MADRKKSSGVVDSGELNEYLDSFDEKVVAFPIDGVLDLHTFKPGEVKDLVPEYLAECRKLGILEVRIIHGKGSGVLRRIVHSTLEKIDFVKSFRVAGHASGGWGATSVDLYSEDSVQ